VFDSEQKNELQVAMAAKEDIELYQLAFSSLV
jgi:hypothetical protein